MNYGKKSTQKREKELTSKSTMIRKKFYVIFCKSLLVCVFAVMVIVTFRFILLLWCVMKKKGKRCFRI